MEYFLFNVIQIIWVLLSLFLQYVLGSMMVGALRRKFKVPPTTPSAIDGLYAFSLGLLTHLWAVFLLKQYLLLPWWIASIAPLAPTWFGMRHAWDDLRRIKRELSINFLLWFFVIVALGTTLMQASNGIVTAWTNNYGDLTWHLGIISNFVLGDRFPIEYHIYPGLSLSYPFFVNFWSALLWWPHPEYQNLALIFCLQWCLSWFAVFIILKGNRNVVLPWALLFGGGAYHFIDEFLLGQGSWTFINSGHPWTVFISTVWVPQRAAMMGAWLAALGVSFFLSSRIVNSKGESLLKTLQASLILSLAALVHTHFAVACGLFMFTALVIASTAPTISNNGRVAMSSKHVFMFFLGLLPGILALPHLLGKSKLMQFIPGWTGVAFDPNSNEVLSTLLSAFTMWLTDAWPILLVFCFLCLLTRDLSRFLVLSICFLIFNNVKLAAWDWDQLKFFIGLYIVVLCIIAQLEKPFRLYLQLACLILCIPALVETSESFAKGPQFTVFSAQALRDAKLVELNTDQDAIIAAKPDHNHPVLLTGRRLYYGYEGTLWSHGVDENDRQQRKQINESLAQIAGCTTNTSYQVCPTHIYFSSLESRMWNRSDLQHGFKATNVPFLYRVE